MKLLPTLALVTALLLLGCYSTPTSVLGTDAPLITTSKNFTMKEGWQESFKLISGDSTEVHTVAASHIVSNAATLRIDSKPVTLTIGSTHSVSLNGKTVFLTLDSITDDYAKFTISLTPQSGQPPQGGGQQLLQNGVACSNNSACLSNHCSNGYCCASGSCCISNSNCSVGECSTTTYNCSSITPLSSGFPCNSNSDCLSNHCNNGYCCASGKCCLSASNCASGEVCNTAIHSCAQAATGYTAADAEVKANSTIAGTLLGRFSSIFNSARQCTGGNETYKQCVPNVVVTTEKMSASVFNVTYSYSSGGTGCCPTSRILVITVDLSANTTTTQWIDSSQTTTLADTMSSSLISNCISALQYIAQVRGLACPQ
ncbi:MAG: hypothetical protein NT130_02150 [Candidatus Micrarchaeota archaeon]|nr:hypothetical protein [Candidatus Micrarchaeota archaeon]